MIYHGEVLPGQTREDNLKKLEERFSQQRGRRGGNRRPRQQGNTQQGGE